MTEPETELAYLTLLTLMVLLIFVLTMGSVSV